MQLVKLVAGFYNKVMFLIKISCWTYQGSNLSGCEISGFYQDSTCPEEVAHTS